MVTRSNIAYKTPEGKIRSIYSHWDGYPEGVGATLKENYTDLSKVEALIELGAISELGSELGYPTTVAYYRDLHQKSLDIDEYDSIEDWLSDMEAYAYLYTENGWLIVARHDDRYPELVQY